ncbi:PHP domain-containing protein [Methylosarcina fibrata]|uniref:PHP domain-containing protein n=1 Tax=Methylosarcina fibrata TaxID=105972 RepID=UPI00037869A3|nr:PHP domain-containing protein [Methylosarcina fibrata]
MTATELYDLHCHSTASDGALSPAELVQRARLQGVTALALTDHDTTAGLAEARAAAAEAGIRFIDGIELSTTWQGKCLHVVGLNVDPAYPPLAEAVHNLQNTRLERAEQIALKLEKKRIPGALEAVRKAAGEGMITRTHFADFLLSQGHVGTLQEAFDRYLAKGKPAYVPTPWVELEIGVGWLRQSGGVAVLAHPTRYDLTASWMRRLLAEFKAFGGQAIEVVTGRSTDEEIKRVGDYARRFELAGSTGSDFHNPANQWVELGRLEALPDGIVPVWELLPKA